MWLHLDIWLHYHNHHALVSWILFSQIKRNIYNINHVDQIERRWGLNLLKSLSHPKPVVNSMILLPVKLGQDDLQLVIFLAGHSVDQVKAKPTLSLKKVFSCINLNWFLFQQTFGWESLLVLIKGLVKEVDRVADLLPHQYCNLATCKRKMFKLLLQKFIEICSIFKILYVVTIGDLKVVIQWQRSFSEAT